MELRKCGISTSGPLEHFELLLHVKMMASSASEYDVVACHILPEALLISSPWPQLDGS